MARIFTAIDLPQRLAEEVLSLRGELPGANWENRPHITLTHYGEVANDDVDRVEETLDTVAFNSFELQPTKIGFFGETASPFVMWIGLAVSPALDQLQNELAEVRAQLVRTPERNAYTPHVTLARTDDVERDRSRPTPGRLGAHRR